MEGIGEVDADEVAESFADGKLGREELAAACAAADRAHFEAPRRANFRSLDAAPHTAEHDLSCSAADAAASVADAVQIAAGGDDKAKEEEWQQQARLLQYITGNPFRSIALEPAWLTWNDGTAIKLAQAIYDDRAFDRMPILADALQEAGCNNADILNHCRQSEEHVPGCWVVDMLLGKE